MYGRFIRLPDGSGAFVDYAGKDPGPAICAFCKKPSTLQCDYPTGTGTCDKHLCTKCALSPRQGKDYCPDHQAVRDAIERDKK